MMDAIFKFIVAVVILIFTYFIIPLIQQKGIEDEVKILVRAAEQIFNGSKRGQEKYEYVSGFLAEKFNMPEEEIQNVIESAVYEMKEKIE